jgi:hypothetical protein
MNSQSFYPVFETGQVLTSEQLNDIVHYLEPQNRLSRRLAGIGIVCGFRPVWDAGAGAIRLGAGVAVTSDGDLIAEDEVLLDRVRPYTAPVASGREAGVRTRDLARYPYLFSGNRQRAALELLPSSFEPARGEAAPARLTAASAAGKTVMLFLECNVEALRNCDINDCSDKGSEMSLTLRRLLIDSDLADRILDEEGAIAGRPVDRASHPRLALEPLAMEKIPAREIGTVADLHQRTLETATNAAQGLVRALDRAYRAYQPLLEDMFPAASFPAGPVPAHHFLNPLAALAETPALVQHFHSAVHDMVESYNEFLQCAALYDGECRPHPGRFPLHVLAGDVMPPVTAFAGAPRTLAEFERYDPLGATGGPAPEGPPAPRRHHFVPSPAAGAHGERLAELRSLFARTLLLAQTYRTRGFLSAQIGLTPSRSGAAPLGARAIPFYYSFAEGGDLHHNWWWQRRRTNSDRLVGAISSYVVNSGGNAFDRRQGDEDFIRVEGLVGKPLGTAMAELIRQRRDRGVAFSVEPVWIGWGAGDERSREAAAAAMNGLLRCRLNEIDIVFRAAMGALFDFALWVVRALGSLEAMQTTARPVRPNPDKAGNFAGMVNEHGTIDPDTWSRFHAATKRPLIDVSEAREISRSGEHLRTLIATNAVRPKALMTEVFGQQAGLTLKSGTVAAIFAHTAERDAGGNLFDRVRAAARKIGPAAMSDETVDRVYPAVSLMARAEELMRVTSATSLADLDEAALGTALRGFAVAYEDYADSAVLDPEVSSPEIAQTNAQVVANRSFVSAAARFAGASLTRWIDAEVQRLFGEQAMPRYAELHPGMEHKGGVAQGGTLILLYAARADLEKTLAATMPRFVRELGRAGKEAGVKLEVDIANAARDLETSSRSRSKDALDEFVVVADFCLPYACCDGRCGDAEIERRFSGRPVVPTPVGPSPAGPAPVGPTPPAPEPEPRELGTLNVSLFVVGVNEPFARATKVLLTGASGSAEEHEVTGGRAALQVPAGRYSLIARASRLVSQPAAVTVKPGETADVTLVLERG